MAIGYMSEVAAPVFGIAAVAVLPFLPRRFFWAALPLCAVASRLIARGAYNYARPVNSASPESVKKTARFVMSTNMPLEARPVAVVTGTNSGIGYYTAVELAAGGYVTVITCRSAVLTQQTAGQIATEAKRRRGNNPAKYANSPGEVVVVGNLPLECDDFESVRAFARWFSATFGNRNFQVLVNNAGGTRNDTFSRSHPELEYHTAVNFLGPMLLTELLLPELEKHGGRVVYVSSAMHRMPSTVIKPGSSKGVPPAKWNGLFNGAFLQALKELNQCEGKSTGVFTEKKLIESFVRYGASKLLNAYHADVIAQRYRNTKDASKRVYACSLHPGSICTNFCRGVLRFEALNSAYRFCGALFFKRSEEGAQTSLHCAMCPLEELELVLPAGLNANNEDAWESAVSPYFAECRNQTTQLLQPCGWDVKEAKSIVEWGKGLVGL